MMNRVIKLKELCAIMVWTDITLITVYTVFGRKSTYLFLGLL